MRLGINLPHLGTSATADAVARGATRAEELGYDTVWALDRLLWPLTPRDPYPATPDEPNWPTYFQRNLDPIEALTFAAARTETIGLGTSVLDIPFYNPVVLARRLTSLDVLSGGRLRAGFGLGYSRDEYDASGGSATGKGRRADEFLQVLNEIWTTDPVTFDGEFFTVPPSTIGPKPVQQPRPPIYLAAYVPAALRRAATYADGWLPAYLPLDQLASSIRQLRDFAAETGRDPSEVNVIAIYGAQIGGPTADTDREPFTGSLAQVRDDVARVRELGVEELVFDLYLGADIEQQLADMERLRSLVD